ncbi:MAG TPA: A/G-specific adenine glycosylase [Gemmataceae bacterium]|nr:A/G-specific adenine glycosylase [Gemmataceae bacterium]
MDLSAGFLTAQLRRPLLAWFQRQRRDLPWRNTRDPYHIWVSEIMLQQTQAATVIPFFQRFLQTFPTVQALAAADEQQVLRLWEGLGYYRRARHLHQAARQLAAANGEHLPDDPEVWRELPGIGRYTLGAILSQAFDRRLPILEANSIRVLCRLFAVRRSPKENEVQKLLWTYAEKILPRRQVGDFNQALMELGALICTPTAPACESCPIKAVCQARKLGIQEDLPVRSASPKTETVNEVAVVVRRRSKVLVVQRQDEGRWANMWEFPHDALQPGESHEAAAARWLPAMTGIDADLGLELTTLTHTVTRYAITLVCLEAAYRRGRFRPTHYQQGLWLEPSQLAQLPLSSPQRRLAKLVMAPVQTRLF